MEFKLLTKNLTRYYSEKILMPEGATKILVEIAQKIKQDEQLFKIYKNFYLSYIDSGYWATVWEALAIDPYVEEVFGKHASLFYLHAAFERLPLTEQKYLELGISEDIMIETLREIGTWVEYAYNLVGYYCIRNFTWIWRHLEAKMFRLGRLQFLAVPYNSYVRGFYNANEDDFLLLCNSGLELRENGDMQGVCGKEKTQDGFVTEYRETEEYFIGNPVTPYGVGLKKQVDLKKGKWQKVLDKGDYMFEVHIPNDGTFKLEEIIDSYKQARLFFKKYFPDIHPKGMICYTWLFARQLQEMLPKSSNIVKFQRQFYLYPTQGSMKSIWKYVFNELTEEKGAKPDNFLRKQILDYYNEGREIFELRGLFLDISESFGNSSYMDRYDSDQFTRLYISNQG